MCSNRKQPLVPPSLPLNPPQRPQVPPPPRLTPDDRHESSLLVVGPPHEEEQFNRSRIFKTYLKDSIENEASNPTFVVFFRGNRDSKPAPC